MQAVGKSSEHEIFQVTTDCGLILSFSVKQAVGKLSEHEITFVVPIDCYFIR